MFNSNENQNFLANFQAYYPQSDQFFIGNTSNFLYPTNQPQYFQFFPLNQIEIQGCYPSPDSFLQIQFLSDPQIPLPPTSPPEQPEEISPKRSETGQEEKIGKSLTRVRFEVKRKRKSQRDYDFRPKDNCYQTKVQQTRGRNKYSNVYRAFIKLISARPYRDNLKVIVQQIVDKYELDVKFQDFQSEFMEGFPTFTNYINKGEFSKFYVGNKPLNFLFRVLFQNFIRNQGHTHILSVSYKKKMKKQSIDDFLSALRTVHQELTQSPKSQQ